MEEEGIQGITQNREGPSGKRPKSYTQCRESGVAKGVRSEDGGRGENEGADKESAQGGTQVGEGRM